MKKLVKNFIFMLQSFFIGCCGISDLSVNNTSIWFLICASYACTFPDEYQTLLDKKVCRQFCQHIQKCAQKSCFFSIFYISYLRKQGSTICQINWARTQEYQNSFLGNLNRVNVHICQKKVRTSHHVPFGCYVNKHTQ